MYIIGRITVTSILPEELSRLKDIAYNLWWSWNSDAIDLFKDIDCALWEKVDRNPVKFLNKVSRKKLEEKVSDCSYMQKYHEIVNRFDGYMSSKNTWFNANFPEMNDLMIAYFSAEFGINEVLPIYSGGLGILSGDHCKSASDLGIPFTAIGLFYKQGYFNQRINRDGWQETEYPSLNPSLLPILPVYDERGEQAYISVELPGRVVYAKIWQVKIGRVSLYLMDTDDEKNNPADRSLTARLYGGDQETRIQQEIFLGMGGLRVLETLGVKAAVYHINEGHSAFMGLELIRKLIEEKGLSFKVAKEVASSSIVFTTHTPVPAGNDVFPIYMMDKYFSNFWGVLGFSRHEFLDLGLKVNDSQNFNMTILAISLSGWRNGVSKLHGAVTRNIYSNLWPGIPEHEIPISHITNGIHTLTWLSPCYKKLYDKYLHKGWEERLYAKEAWEKIDDVPDEELWELHCSLKHSMVIFIRNRIREQRIANAESVERINETERMLDPNALTIGFARRFATYKRANLIFRDIERIRRILNNPEMPVQIIFAGKAHPADRPAHEIIKSIHDIAGQEGFSGKVVLVDNYNMTHARHFVQGVDVWMNTPRRPLEASGTSGQKAAVNGVINFSVLDGWWCEGYNGINGWVIGEDNFHENEYYQDISDSEYIYDMLENHIIPLYYDRDEKGIPVKWVKMMKESIMTIAYRFNTHRMVQEYTSNMYVPAMLKAREMRKDGYSSAIRLADWKQKIEANWPQVRISGEKTANMLRELTAKAGESVTLTAVVNLCGLEPSDVKVEVYYGSIDERNAIENVEVKEMVAVEKTDSGVYRYCTDIILADGGEYAYTFRVIPYSPDLVNKFDMSLIRWVVE